MCIVYTMNDLSNPKWFMSLAEEMWYNGKVFKTRKVASKNVLQHRTKEPF